ncbi:MAG: hypothetical protein IPM35_18240 [Myxococcales bacterium]|nr:hypothetical protein [Myxococcales bacterium]
MTSITKRARLARALRSGWNEIALRDGVLETDLGQAEKLTLLALVMHAGDDRIAGDPERGLSVRRVAALASAHKDTPARVYARLERAGLVRVLRDPRERHAARFDLSGLPVALAEFLSRLEGQRLSGFKGQRGSDSCPSQTVPAVPPEQLGLSGLEGAKGSLKGSSEGILSPPKPVASTSATETERPKRAARKVRAEGQTDTRLVPLRDYYVEQYRSANAGADPALSSRQWPRAMRALAELLEATKSDDRARLCIARTFADDWRRRRKCQPWDIATDASVILADGVRPNARGWVQRGGGERELEDARRRGEQLVSEAAQ